MAKITQTKTPEDFEKLDLPQLHQLWYHQALTDRKIAIMYGVTKEDVKQKRKELKLGWISSATLFLMGGPKYKNDKSKVK